MARIGRSFLSVAGARIGLADELVSRFRVAWVDSSAPAKGFKYLYLSAEDFRWFVSSSDHPTSPLPLPSLTLSRSHFVSSVSV